MRLKVWWLSTRARTTPAHQDGEHQARARLALALDQPIDSRIRMPANITLGANSTPISSTGTNPCDR